MADAFYENYRNLLVGNGTHTIPDLDTNDIRAALRDEATALNLSTQVDLADVSAGHQAGHTSAALTATAGAGGPSVGSFDFTDETLSSVTGNEVESIDIYDYQTAVASTSPLICNLDSWTNLPFTPNGGDVILQPNASGVFQIT